MRMFLIEGLPNTIPEKFGSNWHNSLKEDFCVYWPIRNKNVCISHAFCAIKTKWGNSNLVPIGHVVSGEDWNVQTLSTTHLVEK